jgi:hypothetical protein
MCEKPERDNKRSRVVVNLIKIITYAKDATAVMNVSLESRGNVHARLMVVAKFAATQSSIAACMRLSLPTKKWSTPGTMTSFLGSAALEKAARRAGSGEY